MDRTVRTYDPRLFAGYIVCSLAAIFYLPTLVPLKPSASVSYAFGYNNRAGVVLALLLIAGGAIWTKGLGINFLQPAKSKPVSGKTLAFALVFLFCCCLAMYVLAGRFGGFGESSYEIDRAWLLAHGRTPYIDFEWPFGAGLLYGPVLLSHLLHVTIVPAYYVFWMVSFLGGTVLLYLVVNLVDYPTEKKNSIFLFLFFAGILSVINMGTHYTFLRYSCPLFFVLTVHNIFRDRGARSPILAAVFAVAFTAILLLISPETAIAHAFACVCIFLFTGTDRRPQRLAFTGGLVAALALVFAIAAKLHVLATLKASGGGADSFPVGFAPHILLYFAALFFCACYIVRRFTGLGITDNTFAVVAYSLPMTAAALGRCDVLHVAWNGEGLFLAALIYASNSRAQWKWFRLAFVSFAIVYPALLAAISYASPLASIAAEQLRDRGDGSKLRAVFVSIAEGSVEHLAPAARRPGLEAKLKKAERPSIPDAIDLSRTYPSWHGTFLAPAAYRPHGDGFGSYMSPQVEYGYYQGFENANTVEAVNQKVAELQTHPEMAVLLPGDFFEHRCTIDFASMKHGLSMNWGMPYFGKGVHSENVRKPFCDFIRENYLLEEKPSLDNFNYGLWVSKAAMLRNQ
jgi:hypothetical protein